MLDRCNRTLSSQLLRCLACLVVISVVTADGRVFVLDLRNSSGPQAFRDAERACASQQARLASAEDLRHAVVECFFSPCTRGWLHGGTVGTTVCNLVGSALKAVDVRTENVTADTAHLDAFCVKDKGVPCGDPPSFPNARLQGHSGFEMGDELLYTCVPGYVMPSGHSAFSLLCDSCGEWYGLVQICVKDETETHIDYEDKYTDSYEEEEEDEQQQQQHHSERPEEAHGEVYEEVHGAAYSDEKISQEQQETSYGLVEYQDQHGDRVVEEEKDRAVEDFVGHPTWEQERRQVVRIEGATATEAPVSHLSQKHMFWFPSEAFQEEDGQSVSTNTGTQSAESKEQESQERPHHHHHHHQHHHDDVDDHDHETESYGDHEADGRDDHDDSQHYDQDGHDSPHEEEEDDHDDGVKQQIPAQHDDLDRWDHHDDDDDDHNDHYDMGEHEDDRVPYGSREYHERDDTYDDHESYENREDESDDHDAAVREQPEDSREHPDRDDGQEHYDLEDNKDNHDDHVHDDHDSDEHHDSHEDDGDKHPRIIFSVATDVPQNVTKKGAGAKTTTDETWLDGYPVIPAGAEKEESTTESVKLEHRERGTLARTTDRPNDVEIRRPVPDTISPEEHGSPTVESGKAGGLEVWPDFIHTPAPYPDLLEPSDSTSYSDTLDYDTQQPAPTDSWHGDLTEHPFLEQGPAPPVHDNDILSGVMEEHNLPGETGERGEIEGEMGETICIGDNCPPRPPSSSLQGPTVIGVIVAVCALAAAVIVGVWCYRRQQQKSSMYEMNGKGQSHSRQGQQIEMQQKV